MHGRIARAAALLTTLIAGEVAAQGGPGGFAPAGPTEVGTITVESADVPYVVTLPGRAVAYQSASIRPRVSGVIESIDYEPGRAVEAGDVLFTIEDDTFEASLDSASAGVAEAEAAVSAAEAALERANQLEGVGTTRASIETAQVTLANAQATLSSARANLQVTQLDLEQTRVRSPIDGIPDLPLVTIGDIVTANQSDLLTTVVRLDPIYVDVQESSASILRNRARIQDGALSRSEQLAAELTLEDGSVHSGTGTLVTPGLSVSTTTGTTQIRFRFDNSDRRILPGQFLRVALTLGTTRALLVPQRATSRSADGTLTAFVARDGRAVDTTLTEAGTFQNAWMVTAGIEEGAKVIVDGLENLRDGAEITTVPVTISEEGVIEDAAEDAAEGQAPTQTSSATDADASQAPGAAAAAQPAVTEAAVEERTTASPRPSGG
ncbi:efflux RND transporter periplasmic adaptor subunit [Paracoccus sp. TK19116]|uniref:Efflux RND transporter periplasmic adaptor subunit n=1 Tax=Paracoccus albicereus TaxID=2922394 RepID=A0ABT1MNI8_9RHOB|nr:efflux RND transporter periplasmic adaptor subunit [Paracoccus albicereus]MCQ0969837.1 efflux RND transporter periplasmic adaptor subunit [Paracoccus albicereus]